VVGASAGARGTASAAPPAPALRTPTRAAAPASLHRVSPSPGGRPLRRFAGYGDRSLGTIVVRSASVLVWNARHPAIQIFTAEGFMLVNSKLPNGAVQLSAGTYRGVRVASGAHWSIELRSRP
jgi:hypothetical protein